jgi:tetratricopeptide (TPR) repeat protein
VVGSYSLRDAARILKVTPQRLRHWERTVLSRLSARSGSVEVPEAASARAPDVHVPGASAPGTPAPDGPADADDFEFRDLVCARAVLGLIQQGIPLRRIRRSVEVLRRTLPDLDDPVGSLRVWAEGSPRMVVDHDGRLLEPDGQMVLDFRHEPDGESEVLDLEDRREARGPDARAVAIEWFERGCLLDSDPETFAEAVDAYRRAVEADPGLSDAHCNLGAVLYNQGERVQARACFERCLEIDPVHVEANFNLANVLEEEGRDREALRHYSNALKGDPLYPDLHVNLALLFEKLGEPHRARLHWARYLQLEPAGAWAEVARGRVHDGRGPQGP